MIFSVWAIIGIETNTNWFLQNYENECFDDFTNESIEGFLSNYNLNKKWMIACLILSALMMLFTIISHANSCLDCFVFQSHLWNLENIENFADKLEWEEKKLEDNKI